MFHLQAPIDAPFDLSVIDTSGFGFLRSLDLPVLYSDTLRDIMTIECGLGERLESLSLSYVPDDRVERLVRTTLRPSSRSRISHPEIIWPKLKDFRVSGFKLHSMLDDLKRLVDFRTLSWLTLHKCNGVGPFFADLWQHSRKTTFVLVHIAIQYSNRESDPDYDKASRQAYFLALLALPLLKSLHLAWFFRRRHDGIYCGKHSPSEQSSIT